ncbi:MAG: ornithine carbamoyltransferase [Lentisphaeria bacterium]
MNKHLMSLNDLNPNELIQVLDLADKLKKERYNPNHKPLLGKSIGMIFTKSSTRTRVSFEVGIRELGGNPLFLSKNDIQIGRSESMSDTAEVLSRYLHGIVIRCDEHETFLDYINHSKIPVINALTDDFHPCQLLADLQTIREHLGALKGLKVAYIGDGASNMANSWIIAAKLAGINLHIGAPKEFHPSDDVLNLGQGEGTVTLHIDPKNAMKDADVVYTDVWVSMGFENEAKQRLELLKPYQVNSELMSHAKPSCKVMHCLPAYRGKEITAEVLDGPNSIIWDEAENRLHAQKAILELLIK